ncbi:hypothetical protein [Cohnella lupini]|uniref:Uncharacterized protein n=1 Tax=Cohnella lupini TaxID=1294267 RepID=A0A3D9I670_9BACL|nr:hypothetical protein [Cohnella lupini]RED57181.1 hypothetical protein DFP95_11195 [Cohnella lupini]
MKRYRIREFDCSTGDFKPEESCYRHMAFYLRAVNRYNAARFDILRGRSVKAPPISRPGRLFALKIALNERLERGTPV